MTAEVPRGNSELPHQKPRLITECRGAPSGGRLFGTGDDGEGGLRPTRGVPRNRAWKEKLAEYVGSDCRISGTAWSDRASGTDARMASGGDGGTGGRRYRMLFGEGRVSATNPSGQQAAKPSREEGTSDAEEEMEARKKHLPADGRVGQQRLKESRKSPSDAGFLALKRRKSGA